MTLLHRAVQAGRTAFVRSVAAKNRSTPQFFRREIEAFFRCGVLADGVSRAQYDGCGADNVVAFRRCRSLDLQSRVAVVFRDHCPSVPKIVQRREQHVAPASRHDHGAKSALERLLQRPW